MDLQGRTVAITAGANASSGSPRGSGTRAAAPSPCRPTSPTSARHEPGAVATELSGHDRPEIKGAIAARFEDIANAIVYALAQPPNVSSNEVLVRPTGQAG